MHLSRSLRPLPALPEPQPLVPAGPEYTPARLPPLPLRAPFSQPSPRLPLSPYAIAGCRRRPRELGLVGRCTRAGEPIAVGLDDCFAHGYFGVPGAGKSYVEAVL